jgi:hypothetical protein
MQRMTRKRSTPPVKPEKPQNPLLKRERELSRRQPELKGIKTVRAGRVAKHQNQAKFHEAAHRSFTREAQTMLAQAQTMMAEALDHSQNAQIHRDSVEEGQAQENLIDEKPLGDLLQSSSPGLMEDKSAKF